MNKAWVSLNLPTSLKAAAERGAQRNGVPLTQFISMAVAEKVGAAGAVEFFKKRGVGGKRKRAVAFLATAPDIPPLPRDSHCAEVSSPF